MSEKKLTAYSPSSIKAARALLRQIKEGGSLDSARARILDELRAMPIDAQIKDIACRRAATVTDTAGLVQLLEELCHAFSSQEVPLQLAARLSHAPDVDLQKLVLGLKVVTAKLNALVTVLVEKKLVTLEEILQRASPCCEVS